MTKNTKEYETLKIDRCLICETTGFWNAMDFEGLK